MLISVLFLVATGFNNAQDEIPIREGEILLANALRTGDKSALLRLTDSKFRVSLDCMSIEKYSRTELHRDNWVDNVSQLRTATYKVAIAGAGIVRSHNSRNRKLPYSELATVRVEETIQFVAPQGKTIEKHLSALDMWVKLDGGWKLTNRSYAPHACNSRPRLSFPHQ